MELKLTVTNAEFMQIAERSRNSRIGDINSKVMRTLMTQILSLHNTLYSDNAEEAAIAKKNLIDNTDDVVISYRFSSIDELYR